MPHYSKNYIEELVLASQLPIVDKAQNSVKEIGDNKSEPSPPIFQEDLLNLFKLLCFIQAWSDPIETWNETDDIARKKIRQLMKLKRNIHKPTRRLIHFGLYKSVSENLQKFKQAAGNPNEEKFIEQLFDKLKKSYTNPESNTNTKKKSLINSIKNVLEYKKFEFPHEGEIFLEATNLISSYAGWPDKLLYGCGMTIGIIAALACGLSTGGAIFVLLVGFSLPLGLVIPLSLLIFLAGTRANFQLFSQYLPQFFQDLRKSGGVTKFIDQEGQYIQLSTSKKALLLPVGFLSLSVGIAAAAIAYLEGTKMIVLIFPVAATCPHLTVILLGILASALLIGLTTVMFKTFIGVLQSQFSWQKIKQDIKEKWRSLNWTKILAYSLKVLVMAAAFFGLCYLDFTGTATLAGLLGWVAADAITLAAIMGDLPFTLITALALCDSLLIKNNSNPDLSKDVKYYLGKIVEFLALIINALGNAALVFTDSCVSRIASIFCFINSYASNRTQEDDSVLKQAREKATQNSLAFLTSLFKPSSESSNIRRSSDEVFSLNHCLMS